MTWAELKELLLIGAASLTLVCLWLLGVLMILSLPIAMVGGLVWVVVFVLQQMGVL